MGKISRLLARTLLVVPLTAQPAPEDQETHRVPGDCGQEYAAIVRHDSKHHHVAQRSTHHVKPSLEKASPDFGRARLDELKTKEELDEESEAEDEDDGQRVHGGIVPGPVVEEDDGVVSPGEAHARPHQPVRVMDVAAVELAVVRCYRVRHSCFCG